MLEDLKYVMVKHFNTNKLIGSAALVYKIGFI